jgi:hypothetical protein
MVDKDPAPRWPQRSVRGLHEALDLTLWQMFPGPCATPWLPLATLERLLKKNCNGGQLLRWARPVAGCCANSTDRVPAARPLLTLQSRIEPFWLRVLANVSMP